MNKSLFKELLKGLKWVILAVVILAVIVTSWYGLAWSLGWYVDNFFFSEEYGRQDYVRLGSCVLVFTLIMQIITVILTGWFLIAWGKSRTIRGQDENNGS